MAEAGPRPGHTQGPGPRHTQDPGVTSQNLDTPDPKATNQILEAIHEEHRLAQHSIRLPGTGSQ